MTHKIGRRARFGTTFATLSCAALAAVALIFPSAALVITTLAFNLLGDGIRDALDPQTERIFAGRRRRSKPLPVEGPALVEPPRPETEGE